MKKNIVITIQAPEIITNPPQQETMSLEINGLFPVEAAMILLSAASQIASKELPPIISVLKEGQKAVNPHLQVVGKA